MANLSNINNKFLVTTGGNVLIGQTSTVGTPIFQVAGNSRFSGEIRTANRLAIKETYFGYSSGYKVVQLGENAATTAISLGYNPIGNTSGGFSGNEILIPNNIRILAPNAADNLFYGVMMFDSNDKLLIGSSNYLMESNYIMALDPATKNVGIGTDSPEQKLHVEGRGIFDGGGSSDILQIRNDNGGGVFGMTSNLFALDLASTSSFRIRQGSSVPFYLKSDGNLGIGTTNPLNRLAVSASNTGTQITTIPVGKFINTGNSFSKLIIGSDNANFDGVFSMDNDSTLANTKLRIYIGNGTNATSGHSNDQIVLQGNGNVGIGTVSPVTKLDVRGGTGGGSFDHATFTSVTNRGLKISTANSSEGQNGAAVIYNAQDAENYGSHAFQIGGSTKMNISRAGDILCTSDGGTDAFRVFNASTGAGDIYLRVEKAYSSAAVSRSAGIILGSNAGNLGSTWTIETNSSNGYFGSGTLDFIHNASGTPSPRMRITYEGNVGIGTTSNISSPLTIQTNQSANSISIIGRNNGANDEAVISFYEYDGTTRNAYILKEAGNLGFATGTGGSATEKMRITSDGITELNSTSTGNFFAKEQTLTVKVQLGNSNVAVPVAFVDHSHSLSIQVVVYQSVTVGRSGRGYSTGFYGGVSAGLTQQAGVGAISNIALNYNNGKGAGYRPYLLEITPTYSSGSAPIAYVIIRGNSASQLSATTTT